VADLQSNCCDMYENYYTASMEAFGSSGNVVFGDFASRTGTSNVNDPFAYCFYEGYRKSNKPNSATVNASNPIWIDFGSSKECNRLKIVKNSPPQMTIEYSDDNETWNTVTASVTSNIYSFAIVSARYWRIYPTSGNWSPTFTSSWDISGISTGAFIFLGKTVPGLILNAAPAVDSVVQASYKIDVPYKTANNLLRIACTVQLQRG